MNTVKQAKEILGNYGLTFRKMDNGEFRVNYKGGSEDSAYYTSDIRDAIETGKLRVGIMGRD